MGYKLYYFDGRGRAEIIRLVFAAAGVPFEEVRFSFEEWDAKFKAMAPTGVCPFLEDPASGKTLVQSYAIARLLAVRHNLMGADPNQFYKIERMMHQLKDVEDLAYAILFGPEGNRAAIRKEFLESKGAYHFGLVAKYLSESGSKFTTGDNLTIADLSVINIADFMEFLGDDAVKLVSAHPEIAQLRKTAVDANKGLAEYLAARKPSQF